MRLLAHAGLVDQFSALAQKFAEMANKEGFPIRAFDNYCPYHFSRLDSAMQKRTLHHFSVYVEVCEETLSSGNPLRNDKSLFWYMLVRIKARPTSDLLSHIEDGDCIEIYNLESVQIFRNLIFMGYCSYTLDDLLCRPWFELYHREDVINQHLMGCAAEIFSGKCKNTIFPDLPDYNVTEIASESKRLARVRSKLVSPLRDTSSQQLIGFVHVVSALSVVSTENKGHRSDTRY